MKIEIRLGISISMCNCTAVKYGSDSCLVPELRSEMHCGRRMQHFEKTQCFYVVTVIVSCLDPTYERGTDDVWADPSGFIYVDYFLKRNVSPPITLQKTLSLVQH